MYPLLIFHTEKVSYNDKIDSYDLVPSQDKHFFRFNQNFDPLAFYILINTRHILSLFEDLFTKGFELYKKIFPYKEEEGYLYYSLNALLFLYLCRLHKS